MDESLEGKKKTGQKKKRSQKNRGEMTFFWKNKRNWKKRKKKRGPEGLMGEGRVREFFQQVRMRNRRGKKAGKGKGFWRKRKQSLEEHFQVDDVLELKLKRQLQLDMDKGTCPP